MHEKFEKINYEKELNEGNFELCERSVENCIIESVSSYSSNSSSSVEDLLIAEECEKELRKTYSFLPAHLREFLNSNSLSKRRIGYNYANKAA